MSPSQVSEPCRDELLSLLEEISGGLAVADNINAIAHLLLELTIRHTCAEKGSLMLVNERQELYILSARGMDYGLARTYRVKVGEGIAGIVARDGQPVKVDDIDADERFRDVKRDRYKTRSFISCPIIGKNKILGVLNINDKKDGQPFGENEFTLVKTISNQAAIALKNALLFNEIKIKAAELEDANQKLIDADIGKSEFLSRISHDLRTPLNSIKGSVYHLKNSKQKVLGPQTEFINIIEVEADKLIGIVEKQLDFLRLENEFRIINKTIIRLDKTLDGILNSKIIIRNSSDKKIEVNYLVANKGTEIVGDKLLVNQLFINLVEGMLFYADSGSPLTISIEDNESVHVMIEALFGDADEVLMNLSDFHNFYLDGCAEGTVKLYLALKAAESHGWQVIKEGGGKRFRISFFIPKIVRQKIEAAINATLERILEFTSELFEVRTCSLMINDEITGDFVVNCSRGMDQEKARRTRINMESRVAGWVAHEGKPLLIKNFETDPRFAGHGEAAVSPLKSQLSLPLKIENRVIGVLNLNSKKNGAPFSGWDLKAASAFIEGISSLVEGVYSGPRTEDELARLLASLNDLLTAEIKYPKKNPMMAHFMDGMMDIFEVGEEERKLALYVSMIYDLGLMLVDRSLMDKKTKLSPVEESTLKLHPYTTLDLLDAIEPSSQVKEIILHHHERFDGSGYPDGLKGEQIPLISRVLAVTDAFFAMIEERPYREALTTLEAVAKIRKEAGACFDPEVVRAFEQVLATMMDQKGGRETEGRSSKLPLRSDP